MAVDRKQLILEAAAKSFSLFGYKATTMDQVAKLANVGKGTIYTFFQNKEELFRYIVHNLITEMGQTAEECIDLEKPFLDNLQAVLTALLAYRKEHQFMKMLVEEEKELGTPAVVEMSLEIEKEIVTLIRQKLTLAIKKGELVECNTELASFLLYKIYSALIIDWERNHPPLSEEEIKEMLQQLVIKGLSNH
ncbi:MAG: TetR/AcrR family transcriptional regulator [Bacillus sp. (in: firmicutes)]